MWNHASQSKRQFLSLVAVVILAMAAPILCHAQDDEFPNLPEVAGIRAGMSAQKAYEVLKAQAGGAQISIGEYPIAGISDKPVAGMMSVAIINKVPSVTIEVWLTTPPSKQTVWAVGEVLQYPDSNQLLTSTIFGSLEKRFGKPLDFVSNASAYWAFDEQGRRLADPHNCFQGGNTSLSVDAPAGAVYQYPSPLLGAMPFNTPCNSFVDVRATLPYLAPNSRYASRIELFEIDHAAMARSEIAYHDYIAQENAREQKKELEKAKQQKGPTF
jgi:hypothetical protein